MQGRCDNRRPSRWALEPPAMLKLNPAIDPAQFARIYAETKCVQISNLFDAESAAALERVLLSLPWRLVCQNDEGANEQLSAGPFPHAAYRRRSQKAHAALQHFDGV